MYKVYSTEMQPAPLAGSETPTPKRPHRPPPDATRAPRGVGNLQPGEQAVYRFDATRAPRGAGNSAEVSFHPFCDDTTRAPRGVGNLYVARDRYGHRDATRAPRGVGNTAQGNRKRSDWMPPPPPGAGTASPFQCRPASTPKNTPRRTGLFVRRGALFWAVRLCVLCRPCQAWS